MGGQTSELMDNNAGTIYKNKYKTPENKQPEYRGTIVVDGVEKQISLWVKEGKNGKFFSATISEPYKKATPEKAAPLSPNGGFDNDNEYKEETFN